MTATMNNKMFWRNYKNLPTAAKILWAISFTGAMIAIALITLEFFGVIGDHVRVEMLLCSLSLWINIFVMNKYRKEIRGEGNEE